MPNRAAAAPMILAPILALSGMMFLSGCGFTPMYGGGPTAQHEVQGKLSNIRVENIPNREGQYLRNLLVDRFFAEGRQQNAAYSLRFTPIQEAKYELDVTKNANATRAELRQTTTLNLIDVKTGKTLLTRSLLASTSYNVLSSQFTTRVSEDDARLNALRDLARQAEQQIVLYFERNAKAKK
jgi:LPS-assembly lipoprotein